MNSRGTILHFRGVWIYLHRSLKEKQAEYPVSMPFTGAPYARNPRTTVRIPIGGRPREELLQRNKDLDDPPQRPADFSIILMVWGTGGGR